MSCHLLALEILREIRAQPVRKLPSTTHCTHGHPWTPQSTYRHPKGWKVCRICIQSQYRTWKKARQS